MTNVELTREELVAYYIKMTKETMPQLAPGRCRSRDAGSSAREGRFGIRSCVEQAHAVRPLTLQRRGNRSLRDGA